MGNIYLSYKTLFSYRNIFREIRHILVLCANMESRKGCYQDTRAQLCNICMGQTCLLRKGYESNPVHETHVLLGLEMV